MAQFNFVLIYVRDPQESARLYQTVLGQTPVESSPTFVMFRMRDGVMLGLWARATVSPEPASAGVSSEIALVADDDSELSRLHREWAEAGIAILQPPTGMDFGRTFTAADADGNRIRVFVPGRAA